MRCYTERILLMAQAFLREAFDHFKNKVATSGRFVIVENFDGITYCPATYAENLFTITDRLRAEDKA